jgi:hypothetical protein
MTTSETMESVIIRHVTGALKRKLYRRASANNTSIRAVVQQVICNHYGTEYERETGKTPRERVSFSKTPLVLKLPASVKRKVEEEGRGYPGGGSDAMRAILCNEFGEPFTPAGRWPARAA